MSSAHVPRLLRVAGSRTEREPELDDTPLLERLGSARADLAWLQWPGAARMQTWFRSDGDRGMAYLLGGFPAPPEAAVWIDGVSGITEWGQWCRRRGICRCALAPVRVGNGLIGTLALANLRRPDLTAIDLDRLDFATWLVAERHRSESRQRRAMARSLQAERRRHRQLIGTSERARIGLELHDQVGQGLSTLLLRIRMAMKIGVADAHDLQILETLAHGTLQTTRGLALGLRRGDAVSDELADAHRYATTITAAAACRLVWRDERTEATLSPRISRVLADAIKESVTNAIRHGTPAVIDVHLTSPDGRAQVAVKDDGTGFPGGVLLAPGSRRGLGLIENRARLRAVGGSFAVASTPGAGTVVTMDVPRTIARRASR